MSDPHVWLWFAVALNLGSCVLNSWLFWHNRRSLRAIREARDEADAVVRNAQALLAGARVIYADAAGHYPTETPPTPPVVH